MPDAKTAAQLLLQARKPGQALTTLPDDALPASRIEAYDAQAELVSLLSAGSGKPAGYKVGCTNATARQMLALDSPFSGRCFEKEISVSPSSIDASTLHMIGIEPEIAVRIGEDLVPSKDWQTADVIDHIEAVMPAIEIVESRFSTWPLMGFLSAIADNGVHRHLVLGEPLQNWSVGQVDRAQVTLTANGKTVREGVAGNVDGGPFGVVAWLANHLNAMGCTLAAGQIVTTGVMTDIYDSAPGEELVAQYTLPGVVKLQVTSS
ncbi:MAG: fumarylacetoacetate hydrolase family protein [Arenicellales bacterium]|nr:fumarylacetoacetate hydrolase family protein [Arenicellales bacterium]MDP6552803.1 fumarylacetoacetate hydrolase family protein [Arenicellales bacterium]MDP6792120.1 fumarylacetoacetate hydrolase family protein [Arenicellales bacterium]MDP6919921.1 fumarylacetoacetate hydrolase family protein [Arenicellales bacterium]